MALATVIALIALAVTMQRIGLAHVRDIESSYVAGRQVTACATASLTPFAESRRPMEELPDELERLVVTARGDVEEVMNRLDDLRNAPPYPAVRGAHEAVRNALAAEVTLYDALVRDPANSRDELVALGAANQRAEARLSTARRWLLVGTGEGWSRRFACR